MSKYPIQNGDPKTQTAAGTDKDIVWMKCRASERCEGNYAKISRQWKGNSGGSAVRYVCQTCNTPFHVNF